MEKLLGSQSKDRRVRDRRSRRFSLVWRERRSGFDRRGREGASWVTVACENALVGLRDRPRVLRLLLITVNALNIVDFLLTLNVLSQGGGEANPIMRSLFAADPVYAGIFKVVAVLLTTWLVWRCRRFRSALQGALVMVAVFAAVFFYHIYGLTVFG